MASPPPARARLTMRRLLAVVVCAVLLGPSCSFLRDEDEQFVLDLSIEQVGNRLFFQPSKFIVNHHNGRVNLANNTSQKHGFAIDDLAEYHEVARRRTTTFGIQELKKGKTYVFYDSRFENGPRGTIKYDPDAEQRVQVLDAPAPRGPSPLPGQLPSGTPTTTATTAPPP